MTGSDRTSARVIRARQRVRNSSLVGFDPELRPQLREIGVDRIQIEATGRWTSNAPDGRSLFENALHFTDANWFNRASYSPRLRPTSVTVGMSERSNSSTVRECKFKAWPLDRTSGHFRINITANPTRTLAHLLVRFRQGGTEGRDGDAASFVEYVNRLPPTSFFLQANAADVPVSLAGADNFLPSTRIVIDEVNRDFWPIFLPIFATKLRQFCITLLAEVPRSDVLGTADHIPLNDGTAILDWSEVRAPQIECYFERWHRTAVAAVRRGGWALLAADHSAAVRHYAEQASFSREGDTVTIGLPLSDIYSLKIYAKTADRIRFEVVRKGKGTYSNLSPPTTPESRMIDIIEHEREHALTVRWEPLAELLAGPDEPTLHDVGNLIDQVGAAVANDADAIQVLKSLLLEGGISAGRVSSAVRQRLVDAGIIERIPIRRRDLNNREKRDVLKAPYRDIHILFADPLR